MAVGHGVGLALLVLACRGGAGAVPLIWGAAAIAGLAYPPTGAAVRGAWNALTGTDTGRHGLRTTALAADSTLVELIFVIGPMIVAVFAASGSVLVALGAVGVSTVGGTLLLAASSTMRERVPHPEHQRTRGLGPLRTPGFLALMLSTAGLGACFGMASVTIPAYASRHPAGLNEQSLASILLALWSVGSAVGGVWYGSRQPAASLARQFGWLAAGVGAGMALLAAAPNVVTLGIGLVVGGAVIAPALIAQNAIVGRIVPASMHNEAYTWLVTVMVGASAAGSSLAGVLVDHGGVGAAFVAGGAAALAAAVVGGLPRGSLARAENRATAAALPVAAVVGEEA
jgi:hypothetical protein